MAVSTTNAVSGPYVANGVTTSFPITFKLLDAGGARVTITVDDVETEIAPTEFAVVINEGGNGGSVVFGTAPAIGDLRVYSEPAFIQEAAFSSGQRFSPTAVNDALDRAAIRDQYLLRKVDALIDAQDAGIVGDVRSDLASPAPGKGADLLGFKQTGSGAVGRTAQGKFEESVSPQDFGAASDGSIDDSADFTAAIIAQNNVTLTPRGFYSIKDVALSNNQSIIGGNARFVAETGGANLVALSDYSSRVSDVYVSGATALSSALFRVKEGRYIHLQNITAVDVGAGFANITPTSPGIAGSALTIISQCRAEDIIGTGITIGSGVSEVFVDQTILRGKLTFPGGLGIVTPGSVGWRQNTPLAPPGNFARGGHEVTAVNLLDFERGFWITDAELSRFMGCGADSISDYGLLVDGASSLNEFYNFFCGTSRGMKFAGSSVTYFNGLTTSRNGVIPPWAAPTFFNSATTFYDIEVRDTAIVTISGRWTGDKRIIVDPTAKLVVDCGTKFFARSGGTVAASATTYLYEGGASPTEADVTWRAPAAGTIVGVTVACVVAPGAGQYTYTVRKNFANTTATVTLSGSTFGGDFWVPGGDAKCATGDSISLQLITNASAPSSRHQCIIHFVPD